MSEEKIFDQEQDPASGGNGEDSADEEIRVEDKRHWQQDETDADENVEVEPARPSILDEFRERAEAAEQKLREYIEAFKRHKEDQEKVRERLSRDVDRKVELQFAELVSDLLETLDNLDRSLEHVRGVPGAEPLAEGVMMARNRFLDALEKRGVARFSPEGQPFDPNEAEALRVDPVDSAEDDQVVTETLSPGYKLRDRVVRAAKVAVGQFSG